MAIRVERIQADIEAIARCTATPDGGATRPTFSTEWAQARAYVMDQARRAGCSVRVDAAGNAHARPEALGWEAPAWLVGSHLDSVPRGGDYDGVAGVVVALELLRSAGEDGLASLPVELVDFAEEEGPTFGLGMLGSRAWVGELTATELGTLRNESGLTYLAAGQPHGVDAARLLADRFDAARYLGLIELHIEQGPGMWRREQRVAIVTAIAGRQQYRVVVSGEANHAGATAMSDRRDALTGAAEMVIALEQLAAALSPQTVVTVGRLVAHPNAVNVIADRVEFTIDFRAPADVTLDEGGRRIPALLQEIAQRRSLGIETTMTESIPARPMSQAMIDRFSHVAPNLPRTVSGALHDAAVLAPYVPTIMLFVPSRDGISHNAAEFSRVEDIATAACMIERVVRRPTLLQLNAMDRDAFVSVCGAAFEHSPWIAEQAWASRPFESLADLHGKMCGVLARATDEQRMALIEAHPDLVGRLAREGRLTAASSNEQAAAGLTALTPAEIAAFERHNEAYRAKFGFPFIICARENRKEAILRAFPQRLQHTRAQEIASAIEEIGRIARFRLADAIWEN
jgi:OHCU decarboxylase